VPEISQLKRASRTLIFSSGKIMKAKKFRPQLYREREGSMAKIRSFLKIGEEKVGQRIPDTI
jgi:hypothetical protein